MRKFTWFLTNVATTTTTYILARRYYRRQLAIDIWEENKELSAQCLRHYKAIHKLIMIGSGETDADRLYEHIKSIHWYAELIKPKIELPATLTDCKISQEYGSFWQDWSRARMGEIENSSEINLSLFEKGEGVA